MCYLETNLSILGQKERCFIRLRILHPTFEKRLHDTDKGSSLNNTNGSQLTEWRTITNQNTGMGLE